MASKSLPRPSPVSSLAGSSGLWPLGRTSSSPYRLADSTATIEALTRRSRSGARLGDSSRLGEQLREARLGGRVEQLVQRRPAQVGGDDQRPVARLRERAPEPRGDRALALGVQGARDEQDLRARVGREREAHRRAQRLVALVLLAGQRTSAAGEALAHIWHAPEQRQVHEPAQLARPGDAWDELIARKREQDADEEPEEERDDRVAQRLRRAALVGRRGGLGDLEVHAGARQGHAELAEALPDRLLLLRRARLALDAPQLLDQARARLLVLAAFDFALRLDERRGDRVGDIGRPLGRAGRGRHEDEVGVWIDARLERAPDPAGALAGNALSRALQDVGGEQQLLDRRQLAGERVDVDRLVGAHRHLLHDAGGRLVAIRRPRRDDERPEHGGRAQQKDQPQASPERVQVAARLDRVLAAGAARGAGGREFGEARIHGDER